MGTWTCLRGEREIANVRLLTVYNERVLPGQCRPILLETKPLLWSPGCPHLGEANSTSALSLGLENFQTPTREPNLWGASVMPRDQWTQAILFSVSSDLSHMLEKLSSEFTNFSGHYVRGILHPVVTTLVVTTSFHLEPPKMWSPWRRRVRSSPPTILC